MKTSSRSVLTVLVLLSLVALGSIVQAVNPPPDGGYAGFNTAEGTNALESLTTGVGNAAVDWYSLFSLTDGSYNSAIGAGTLVINTANDNTATGSGALLSNTLGSENTANGTFTLLVITSRKEVESLSATLIQQSAAIEKVSAQIEMSKWMPQIAAVSNP
jgi:hypothetical protein